MATQTEFDNAALDELTLTVRVIASNYVTKEELAVLNGKIDVLATRVDAMPAQIELAFRLYVDTAIKALVEKYDAALKSQAEHHAAALKEFTEKYDVSLKAQVAHLEDVLKAHADKDEASFAAMTEHINIGFRSQEAKFDEALKAQEAKFDAALKAQDVKLEAALKAQDVKLETALKAQTEWMYKTFATKEDLANAMYQLTWRMAAFGSLLCSAGFALGRYF
jgi:predicted metal-dependent hydrolase